MNKPFNMCDTRMENVHNIYIKWRLYFLVSKLLSSLIFCSVENIWIYWSWLKTHEPVINGNVGWQTDCNAVVQIYMLLFNKSMINRKLAYCLIIYIVLCIMCEIGLWRAIAKFKPYAMHISDHCDQNNVNKAIRDGRPRPPRHQVGWDIVRRECACQISWWSVEKWRRYYILEFRGNTFRWLMTLTFDLKFWKYLSVTEKSYSMCMSSFMMIGWEMAEILHVEISWKHVSVTYDLDLWPKILKIFVSHGVPIRNMYAKFHNDRLRNGWDITLWNFAKTRTKHGQTHKQTDMGITIPRPPHMGGEVITNDRLKRLNYINIS